MINPGEETVIPRNGAFAVDMGYQAPADQLAS
jgi:hypothetical protein